MFNVHMLQKNILGRVTSSNSKIYILWREKTLIFANQYEQQYYKIGPV